MKKTLLLLLISLLLVGCTTPFQGDATVKFNEEVQATYSLDSKPDKELVFNQVTFVTNDSEQPIVGYSLNPNAKFTKEHDVITSNFYRVDATPMDQKDELSLLAYYGYGYFELNESGVAKLANGETLTIDDYAVYHGDLINANNVSQEENNQWYFATQELIWESQGNADYKVTFTNSLEDKKADILAQLPKFSVVPNFGGSVITVTEADITNQTQYTFTDVNNVLSQFDLVLPGELELVPAETPNPNQFTVKLLAYRDDLTISLVRKSHLTQDDTLDYRDADDNRFISFGNARLATLASKIYFERNENLIGATLTISNIDLADSNHILYGGQYEIADDEAFTKNVIQSTLSIDGVAAKFNNVPSGTFYLRQISAPEGYQLSDEVKVFTLPNGVTKQSITFGNNQAEAQDNNS